MSVHEESLSEYSTRDDTPIAGDDLNRAKRLSFSDTVPNTRGNSASNSFSNTVEIDIPLKFNTICSITKELVPKKCKPQIISDEIVLEPYQLALKRTNVTRFPGDSCITTPNRLSTGDIDGEKSINIEEPNMEFDIESIQKSILWPSLTALEDSLKIQDANTSKDSSVVMENLDEVFNYSPRSFTESLMTIMEESFVESQENSGNMSTFFFIEFLKKAGNTGKFLKDQSPSKCTISSPGEIKTVADEFAGDSSSPMLSKFSKEIECIKKLPENETCPEEIKLLPGENSTRSNPSVLNSNSFEIENITSNASEDESMQYATFNTLKLNGSVAISPKNGVKFIESPTIIINAATPVRDANCRTPRKKSYRKTPKINAVTAEKTENLKPSPRRSPLTSNDDDYLTAESEPDESGLLADAQPEPTPKKKLNMSNVKSRNQQISKKNKPETGNKSDTNEKPSKITDRKRKLSNYTNKLQNRSVKELKEKRQKCFDLVEEIMKKPIVSTEEPKVESSSVGHPPRLSKEFRKILSACYDYAQCAVSTSEIYGAKIKKNSTVVATSTITLKAKKNFTALKVGKTERKSRKSLGKIPSPKLTVTRHKLTPSPSRQKSPGVYSCTKTKGLSPIDTSSIRPVAQLRRVFSPRYNTAGFNNSKIPVANISKSKYLPINDSGKTKSVRFVAQPAPGSSKKIVSPVAEYIRGKTSDIPVRSPIRKQII